MQREVVTASTSSQWLANRKGIWRILSVFTFERFQFGPHQSDTLPFVKFSLLRWVMLE